MYILFDRDICNSYTMGCLPVCGDNPRALASGLSYVQVDKHGITSVDLEHQVIFHYKLGKGGISSNIQGQSKGLGSQRGEIGPAIEMHTDLKYFYMVYFIE